MSGWARSGGLVRCSRCAAARGTHATLRHAPPPPRAAEGGPSGALKRVIFPRTLGGFRLPDKVLLWLLLVVRAWGSLPAVPAPTTPLVDHSCSATDTSSTVTRDSSCSELP